MSKCHNVICLLMLNEIVTKINQSASPVETVMFII